MAQAGGRDWSANSLRSRGRGGGQTDGDVVQKEDCFLVPDGRGVGGQRGDPGDFLPEGEKNGTGTADVERASGVGQTLVEDLPVGVLVQADGIQALFERGRPRLKLLSLCRRSLDFARLRW